MKRIILFIPTLCLCLSLTSCSDYYMVKYNPYVYFDADILFDIDRVPDYSENFDEDFISSFDENYTLDSHLGYYSASEWEAEIEDDSRKKIRFSLIDGFEDKQFVARSQVLRSDFPALANVYCHLDVYRHKDAPDPMTDWTIESVSFIAVDHLQSPGGTRYETSTDAKYINNKTYVTLEELVLHQMSFYDTEASRICTFDRESDPGLIEMIEKNYAEPRHVDNFNSLGFSDENSSYNCYIVIRFEESDNIVWYCELQRDYTYTEIYLYSPVVSIESKEDRAVIDGEYAELIYSLIFAE